MILGLVNLCLDTIVENFSRYNSAFHTTKDKDLKRNFEFLQRKYSFELLSRLNTKGESLEKYVDLLINKYLKVLDTIWLKNCTWEEVTSKIAEIGPNIEKIILREMYLEDKFNGEAGWQDIICHLPNLKSFILQDSYCLRKLSYSVFENLAKFCPNIEEINIVNLFYGTGSLENLCFSNENGEALFTKLKRIHIEKISLHDLSYLLQNFPSLEVVDCDDLPLALYSMHKDDPFDKIPFYNITSLDLTKCYDPLVRKVSVSVCPYLKSLAIAILNTEELINFIPHLSELEQLHITNDLPLPEININEVFKSISKKLVSLKITSCSVSVSTIAENCPHLKELHFSALYFLDENDSKPVLDSLSSLTFEYCDVSTNERAIRMLLSSSEKIESLSFLNCGSFSSDIKVYISKYSEQFPIKKLSFSSSEDLKDLEFIKHLLTNCRTLNYLNVDGCFNRTDAAKLVAFAKLLPDAPDFVTGLSTDIRETDDDEELIFLSDSDDFDNFSSNTIYYNLIK